MTRLETREADRARSKLQTMTNTALLNLAGRHGVGMMQGGRIVTKKQKIARLMMCDAVVAELGRNGGATPDAE